MVALETPICDFGWKAPEFNLIGIDNKYYSFQDIKGQNGNLYIQSDQVVVIGNQSASTVGFKFTNGGAAELFHNNNDLKNDDYCDKFNIKENDNLNVHLKKKGGNLMKKILFYIVCIIIILVPFFK